MESWRGTNRLAVIARAKVIRVLNSHFHEDLEPDAEHAGGKSVPSNHFRKVLASHGSGILRIRHGNEEPHANFITRLTGLEKDTGAGNADRAAHIFKEVFVMGGRTEAHKLRYLAPADAAALRAGKRLVCGASCWMIFGHQIVLGRHQENHLSGKLPHTLRENCSPWANRKP